MKKLVFVSVMALSTLLTYAQHRPAKGGSGADHQLPKEKVEAMKIAFLTKELDLTPEEAQAFWPVYNEYDRKLTELRKGLKHDIRERMQELDKLNDKELEAFVDEHISFRQRELELDKEFHQKLKNVLPIKKVALFYAAEMKFKKELLRRYKEHGNKP